MRKSSLLHRPSAASPAGTRASLRERVVEARAAEIAASRAVRTNVVALRRAARIPFAVRRAGDRRAAAETRDPVEIFARPELPATAAVVPRRAAAAQAATTAVRPSRATRAERRDHPRGSPRRRRPPSRARQRDRSSEFDRSARSSTSPAPSAALRHRSRSSRLRAARSSASPATARAAGRWKTRPRGSPWTRPTRASSNNFRGRSRMGGIRAARMW